MNTPTCRPLPLAIRPAGDPIAPIEPVSVAPGATAPTLPPADVEIARRVREARGPLGGSGPHQFTLLLRDAPADLRVFARVLDTDPARQTVREVRAALTLGTLRVGSETLPAVTVPRTAVAIELEAPTWNTVTVPWEAIAASPDGSDRGIVDVSQVAGFWRRHRGHILLGGAIAGVVGLAWWAAGPRANPSCGPSCGCAPCRAAHRPNPSRTRRRSGGRSARR